jgi:hypothetical protein
MLVFRIQLSWRRLRKFKLPEDMDVVCDGWPYGRDSEDDLPRYVQVRVLYSTLTLIHC